VDTKDVKTFLEHAGLKNIQIDQDRGWVRASCPFAPYKHQKGTDSNPSFGVRVPDEEVKTPYYTCLSCDSSGSLPALVASLQFLTGKSLREASLYIQSFPEAFPFNEANGEHKKKRVKVDKYLDVYEQERHNNVPIPQKTLDNYPLIWEIDSAAAEEAKDYLKSRKISEQVVKDYQLRLYVDYLGRVGIITPIMAQSGKDTLDLWVRMVASKRFFRLTAEMTGCVVNYKATGKWFGQQYLGQSQTVILVEGAFDLLRLVSIVPNRDKVVVLASFGMPSKEQIDGLYATNVFVGFDADDAGKAMASKVIRNITVPFLAVLYWDLVGVKDAGDLSDSSQFVKVYNGMIHIDKKTFTDVENLKKSS